MLGTKFYEANTPEQIGALLDLSPEETELVKLRAEVLIKITHTLAKSRLTHAEIALKLKTSRTRITRILNGKEEHVTFDFLVKLLFALGYKANLQFKEIA